MPNTKSAKKALRQDAKRAARNAQVKHAYKDAIKAVKKTLETGGKDAATALRTAQQRLDKAAQKGVIKQNTAARKLSRLTALAKKMAAK